MDEIQFEIEVQNRQKYGEITNSKRSVSQNKFKIEVPIKVLPKQGKVSFDTSISVNIEVYNIKQNLDNQKEVTIPQIKMSLDRQIDIKNWKCEEKTVDQCNRI